MRRHSSSARIRASERFNASSATGFGEGLTQVITEDIMDAQGISLNPHDRPYEDFAAVMREVVQVFGLDAMARAYFFGDVASLRTSMEARWGLNWHAVAGATTAGQTGKGAHADSSNSRRPIKAKRSREGRSQADGRPHPELAKGRLPHSQQGEVTWLRHSRRRFDSCTSVLTQVSAIHSLHQRERTGDAG